MCFTQGVVLCFEGRWRQHAGNLAHSHLPHQLLDSQHYCQHLLGFVRQSDCNGATSGMDAWQQSFLVLCTKSLDLIILPSSQVSFPCADSAVGDCVDAQGMGAVLAAPVHVRDCLHSPCCLLPPLHIDYMTASTWLKLPSTRKPTPQKPPTDDVFSSC